MAIHRTEDGQGNVIEQWETPEPALAPVVLGKYQFIELAQTAGGLSDDQLVDLHDDTSKPVRAFWIKFNAASEMRKTDPATAGALTALEYLGYLPNGAAAVLDAWPEA
jgi:hypothetical protein